MIRIGTLVPELNTTVEPEMYKIAPEGVTIHFSRITFKSPPPAPPEEQLPGIEASLDDMGRNAPKAAQQLAVINPKLKVMGFSCNSASFYKGIEYEDELVRNIEAASGIPTVSASGAMIEAFKELGCYYTITTK